MAVYSRSNINDTRDSSGKKVSQDGVFTGVRFNQSDWKTRNSYDVFFNLRRVGAMSGISSVEDYELKTCKAHKLALTMCLIKT